MKTISTTTLLEGSTNALLASLPGAPLGRESDPRRSEPALVLVIDEAAITDEIRGLIADFMRGQDILHLVFAGESLWQDFCQTLPDSANWEGSAARWHDIIRLAAWKNEGLSAAVGRWIHEYGQGADTSRCSLAGLAWELDLPTTAMPGIGINSMFAHPDCDPASLGKALYNDWAIWDDSIGSEAEITAIAFGDSPCLRELCQSLGRSRENIRWECAAGPVELKRLLDRFPSQSR